MPPRRKPKTSKEVGLVYGFRSGLEGAVGDQLRSEREPYLYEVMKLPFIQPAKPRTYTPDFILRNGIVVETKGRFLTADRQKHLLIQAQHPALDLRFVFSSSRTKISKQSKTTYARWCETNGFLYADKMIPSGWLSEPPNSSSQDALIHLLSENEKHAEALEKVLALFGR